MSGSLAFNVAILFNTLLRLTSRDKNRFCHDMHVISLHAEQFSTLFLSSAVFFLQNFKAFFQEFHQSVKQFASRSGLTQCRA